MANVHLHSHEGIAQRYNLHFEAGAATVYAPMPQFRSGHPILAPPGEGQG